MDADSLTLRSRAVRTLRWVAGLVGLWALLGFVVAPLVVRPVLQRKLTETLHRKVTVRHVAINPFTLATTLRGVSIEERGSTRSFAAFESLHVNLEAVSLFRGGPVLREVVLESPSVSLVRNEDQSYNVSDLIEELGKSKPDAEPARFSINNIRLRGGKVDFDDRPNRTKHEVRDLSISIPFLSNVPSRVEIFTQPSLSATVDGAPVGLRGRTKPFSGSRETAVEIDLGAVDVPRYLAYLPKDFPVRLAKGRLDANVVLSFLQPVAGRSRLLVSGKATLGDAALLRGEEPLLSFRSLGVVVGSYDVFGGELSLTSVSLLAPDLAIRRGRDGAFELASLFETEEKVRAPEPRPAGEAKAFAYEVGEARVEEGTIRYTDLSLGKPFEAKLSPVGISVRGLSSKAGGQPAALDFTARSDAGESLKHAGTFTLGPLSFEGAVELTGVPLKTYAPWYERALLAEVRKGTLDVAGRYTFTGGPDGNLTVKGLSVRLASLVAARRGEKKPFLDLPAASLSDGELDIAGRTFSLGTLASAGGHLFVTREPDGSVDLAKLVAASEPSAGAEDATAKTGTPWVIRAKKLSLERYTFEIDDRVPARPAHLVLRPATVVLENVSTEPGTRGTLATSFGLDGKGLGSATGEVGFSPVFARLKVRVKDFDLVPLEPYLLAAVQLTLTSGRLNGAGALSFSPGPNDAASLTFEGDAALSAVDTVERGSREEFLRWDSLSLTRIRAGFNPVFVEAARMAASGVACLISVSEDGTMNLRRITGAAAAPADEEEAGEGEAAAAPATPAAEATPTPATLAAPAAPAPAEPPMPLRLDLLTVEKSALRLSDRSVNPAFETRLEELNGRVSGLSSVAGTRAEVDIRASLVGESPLSIAGTVNPVAAAKHADLTVSWKDVDLVPMTPYFGKFVGYSVAKGKLTLALHYRLESRKLEAENKLLVDQFTFGGKVESKTATKLPVRLAVSILKDRNGLIDLDLPVTGSLDDPKFRLGKVVWKALGNVLTKIVTSPFALLGKAFGGGQELSFVEFEAGRETLGPATRQRLDALASALAERPALKLEVIGRAGETADAEGLKRLRFERKVKVWKLEELAKAGTAPVSIDEVVVPEEEWPALLKKAYKKERFQKPRTALGLAKDIPPAEMESLMLANIEVGPGDVAQLALSRAEAVKAYLVGTGKVEAGRVFLVQPGSRPAEKKDGVNESRVDFSLE